MRDDSIQNDQWKLTPPPPHSGQNGRHFTDDIFKRIFFEFHWSLFPRVQLTKPGIGLGNGLAPKRRQAITWTNADLIHWRIYAALGEDELTK